MRTYTSDCIVGHAYIVQERMLVSAAPFGAFFVVFALLGFPQLAIAFAIPACAFLGASGGAWLVAGRFK